MLKDLVFFSLCTRQFKMFDMYNLLRNTSISKVTYSALVDGTQNFPQDYSFYIDLNANRITKIFFYLILALDSTSLGYKLS